MHDAAPADPVPAESRDLAIAAAHAAADKGATEVLVLDVGDLLGICGYFVIASASNPRQVKAVVDEVELRGLRRVRQRTASPKPIGHDTAVQEGVADAHGVAVVGVPVVETVREDHHRAREPVPTEVRAFPGLVGVRGGEGRRDPAPTDGAAPVVASVRAHREHRVG